jgi:lipid II:glycine glycyltransferase (peptidoglycan interpeptide bridge formation enzyme)
MKSNYQDWQQFVSSHRNTHLLQQSAWGDFKGHFGWEVCRVQHEDSGAQILFQKLPFGYSWGYIPKGPVGKSWESLWPYVDRVCHQRKAVFLKVEPDIWMGDNDSLIGKLADQGFSSSAHHIQPRTTLVVDLSGSSDDIMSRMKQKTRYNIRLSGRKGVRVETGAGHSERIEHFYNLMEVTGIRDGFGIHSREYYKTAYDIFWPDGQCELFSAWYESKILAALMVFVAGQRAWYFYGASSDQHRNLMAPYAVQWAGMQWAKEQGCLEYDLWGIPDEDLEILEDGFTQRGDGLWGVYRFKRGFGGRLKRSIGSWDRVYNRILYLFYLFWVRKTQT